MTSSPGARAGRGIILDFDGVLVQSMERHAQAYRETMKPYGVLVTDQMVFEREGGRSETLIRDFLRLARPGRDDDLVRRLSVEKQKRFEALGPPPLYPGGQPLVESVRRAFDRMGLVTGTRRENVTRLIPQLLPHFDVVIAQDGYTHDKPHPEPYRRAAEALGIPPARCAALENAPNGVRSAVDAGYGFVAGLTTTLTVDDLRRAGAHVVAGTHDEAAALLAKWARQA